MRTVTCETTHQGRQVYFVLEELNDSKKKFWYEYIKVVSTLPSVPSKDESGASGSQKTVSVNSDLDLAFKGFLNALDLPDKSGIQYYAAYATFDPHSAATDDEWKALNIQMCMTVSGMATLPFTTHMGIFASPLSTATALPDAYRSLQHRLGDNVTPKAFFENRKVGQLSLLLHSFAIQAYTALNVKTPPLYLVTKPIASMGKIFKNANLIEPSVHRLPEEKPGIIEYLATTSQRIGYTIDRKGAALIGIKHPLNNMVIPLRITPLDAPHLWILAFNPSHQNETSFVNGAMLAGLHKMAVKSSEQ